MRVAIFLILITAFNLSVFAGGLEQKLDKITEEFLKDGAFSAVSISISGNGKNIFSINKGITNLKLKKKIKVTENTVFDLASLTKPVVVGSLFYYLEKEKKLDGNWKVSKFFPKIKQDFTLNDLLTHNTCLPPWLKLCSLEKVKSLKKRKKIVADYIAEVSCKYEPKYSDINYILLGFIIEKITGKTLDKSFVEFMKNEFRTDKSFTFNPLKNGVKRSKIAATSYSYEMKKTRQGEVEDRNCDFLDGVTGNAGLFGTARDITDFYTEMLKKPWYRKQIIAQKGYDKKEGDDSNYGNVASPKCSGHLGWTGTAFLICPKNDLVITILTNRTHSKKYPPANLDQIKLFRQAVFDAVLKK